MNDMYKKAGMRIKIQREKMKCTREKLAELADISPKFLYEIEMGNKGFSAYTLSKIAKALYVQTDYILYGKDANQYNANIEYYLDLFDEKHIGYVEELLKSVYHIYEINVNVK